MDTTGQLVPGGSQACTPHRGVGRPSTVIQHESLVTQWLREGPDISGAEILRRARLAGYRGGKSALYELVRRLRAPGAIEAGWKPVANGTAQ
jgi:hypothetical protein